ncbi:DUF938 domain-containing protein [Sulfitobacter sp. LCG007]
MTRKLPPEASVAQPMEGAKLFAPSAERNAEPIARILQDHAPARGRALEIASGTGQHVVIFACALPGLTFHPTDVAPDRLASIDAHVAESGLGNVEGARMLDAGVAGWSRQEDPFDLVVLVNLLHLVSAREAETIVREASAVTAPAGTFLIYGPFRRGGRLTSEGDMRFDADLRRADPEIGYKDDDWVEGLLADCGLRVARSEMPANNLALIARRD